MYSEFAKDAKVQSLDENLQRRLVMLFCLQCSQELPTLSENDLAFALAISVPELRKTKNTFIKKGFIDENYKILNWDKRQFKSDTSTYRTRAYRERQRANKNNETSQERHGNVTRTSRERNGNVLDTDTETETYKKKLKQKKIVLRETEAHETQGDALSDVCLFSKFWDEYPNKVDKKKSKTIFKGINPDSEMTEKIISSLRKQKLIRNAKEKRGEFVPAWKNPTTWLTGECWNDELIAIKTSSGDVERRVNLNSEEIKKLKIRQKKLNNRVTTLAVKISTTPEDKRTNSWFELQEKYYQEISSIETELGRANVNYLND
jgi:hypothetical protein